MDNRDMKPITEFCSINMGQSPDSKTYNEKGEGMPFYQGNADFGELHPKTRVWCSAHIKIANKDDILISVRAPIGAMNIATEECCIGRGLAAITPNEDKCKSEYLFYALKSRTESLIAQGTGSTFKAISRKVLEGTQIPDYNEKEQEFIIEAMSSTEKAIKIKNEELENLEQLIKARFVEMFGDAVINSMSWEEHCLDEYITFLTSGSRGWSQYFVDTENELFITIKNVKNNHITLDNIQYVDAPDNKEAERTKVRAGDLLISITADLGRTGVVDEKIANMGAYINQHLSLVRLDNSRINPLYVSYFLETEGGKIQFESKNQNGVKAGLNFDAIKSLKILVPPMDMQNKYIEFIEQVESAKQVIKQQLEELETLKKSLMQKYFG